MKRSGPIKRKTRLARKAQLPKKNAKRAKKRREEAFGDKADWIRSLSCATCHTRRGIQAHHARSRGAGGKAESMVPLCWRCHRTLHDTGVVTFEERTGIGLHALAERLDALWQAMNATREAA